MRTAILFGAMIIASAIAPNEMNDLPVAFAVVSVFFFLADAIDVFAKLR